MSGKREAAKRRKKGNTSYVIGIGAMTVLRNDFISALNNSNITCNDVIDDDDDEIIGNAIENGDIDMDGIFDDDYVSDDGLDVDVDIANMFNDEIK